MPILIDDDWYYEGSSASRDRQVYRSSLLIGRVRRCQSTNEDDSLIRERFTVEQWQDEAFIPIEGEQPSLEGALQRLLGYDATSIEGMARRFTMNDAAPLIRFGIVATALMIVAMVLMIAAAGWALEYWL